MSDVLLQEHLLLGALMVESDGQQVVSAYAGLDDEMSAFVNGVALCDLSGITALLIDGLDGEAFAHMLFAGRRLAVGEVAFEAALTGEGGIVSVPLVMRTGQHEHVCWDLSSRSALLDSWAGFLAQVEQRGQKAFPNLGLEDVSDAFVPLLLCGPAADAVLKDYLGTQQLPEVRHAASLQLDRIGCIVATLDLGKHPCYMVLVPPAFARVLWRSFLSFTYVTPVGREALRSWALGTKLGDVVGWLKQQDRVQVPRQELISRGLVRADGGFVGERGLS